MNNYLHPGNTLTLAAPYDVNGGDCIQVGAIFGVAKSWASRGEQVEIITTGVFDVRKRPGQKWEVGEKLYWEAQNRAVTNSSSGNCFIGVVIEPTTGQSAELGRIKIFGLAQ